MTFFSDSMIIRPRVSSMLEHVFFCFLCTCKETKHTIGGNRHYYLHPGFSLCVCVCVCLCSDNVGKKVKKKKYGKGKKKVFCETGPCQVCELSWVSRSMFSGNRHCCWVWNCILLVLFGLLLMSQDREVEHSAEFWKTEPCSSNIYTESSKRNKVVVNFEVKETTVVW